jgi:phosphoenolpyruvate carboxylase
MFTLLKAWTWLKNYWYFPVIAIVALCVLLYTRNPSAAQELLKISRESHAEEKEILEKAEKDRLEKEARVNKKYEEALKDIEDRQTAAEKELNSKKRKELKRIIKETDGDPDLMAEKLRERFGI